MLLLVGAAIVIPIVLKEPITKAVKEEVNAQLNANIDFEDVTISLIRSFPDLYVGVDELSITGQGEFEGFTLLYLHTLVLDVDLMTAFSGSPTINEIGLSEGLVNVIVLHDGQNNYEIFPESEEETDTTSTASESGAFGVSLKHFYIDKVAVMYTDNQGHLEFKTGELNMDLSGDFAADRTNFQTDLNLREVLLNSDGTNYLNHVELELKAGIDADVVNKSFTLNQNEFRINGLHLALDGNVAMPNDDDIEMDLTYSASKTEFKEILSLIPTVYTHDFKDVEATGSLEVNGMIKGTYNEKSIPGFTSNIKVENGQFKYPQLPKSVDAIQVDLSVLNPGGDVDNTVIDMKRFKFELASNPFDAKALVKTPVSDPNIDASFKGKIELTSLADAIPMEEGDKLSGTVIADAEMKGKQSDIDKGRYDKFTAKGEFILREIEYTTEAVAVPVQINYAQFKFAPRFLELASFDARAGNSDFKMKGKITNYLGYVMSDGTLKGDFSFNSTIIDGNELAGLPGEESSDEQSESGSESGGEEQSEPFRVPKNLDITLNTDVKKIDYDNITLLNTKGKVVIRNGKADLRGLSFNTLGGTVAMNGYYDSSKETMPKLNYDLNVQNIVVKDAYTAFGTVRKLAPIAEKTEGKASIQMNVSGSMASGTEVNYNSLNGGGRLTSQSLKITGTETLNKVAQVVKINAFKNPEVKDVNLSFKFMNGRVHVQPFDVKIGPVAANIFGSHGFDETMDYVMSTSVPTSALGGQANSVINGLVSQANSLGANFTAGDKINVDILIKGTFDNPKVTPSFKNSGQSMTDNLKQQAEDELKRQQERLMREAEERARQEAERLRKEAEERAKKEAGNLLNGLFGRPK